MRGGGGEVITGQQEWLVPHISTPPRPKRSFDTPTNRSKGRATWWDPIGVELE